MTSPKKLPPLIKGEGIAIAASEAVKAHLLETRDSDSDNENLYRQVVDEVERPLLEEMMTETGGNQSRAAMRLGMNRATLRSKLKRHGLL